MSEKYAIKNCPLYERYNCFNIGKCKNGNSYNGMCVDLCQDITDCLLKQIVEKCQERYVGYLEDGRVKDEILKLIEIEGNQAKNEILQMLDIEEFEQ